MIDFQLSSLRFRRPGRSYIGSRCSFTQGAGSATVFSPSDLQPTKKPSPHNRGDEGPIYERSELAFQALTNGVRTQPLRAVITQSIKIEAPKQNDPPTAKICKYQSNAPPSEIKCDSLIVQE